MREMGRKGGKRRLETMTPEERSESARKAAAASAKVRSKKAAAKAAKKTTKRAAKPARKGPAD
jgi:hypothetical protein